MNLVSFSIKTKGIHNFARRLWTVCTRFSFSEARTHQALHTIISSLQKYNSSPTFFIPGVILWRHPTLIAEIARCGAEIGIHGYVHNDYRFLSKSEQQKQTQQAISVFQKTRFPIKDFAIPILDGQKSRSRSSPSLVLPMRAMRPFCIMLSTLPTFHHL
jgi:Polysaccharide deacetylase